MSEMKKLLPDLSLNSIYELTPEMLREMGVCLLLMDLDNTLSPYHIHEASAELKAWVSSLMDAGIEPFILSNNKGQRPALFAGQLGIEYIGRAKKPSVKALGYVLEKKGIRPEHAAVIGDQIFTDTLCARRAGTMSVLVRPICITRNPLLALRYWAETPFRLAAGRKNCGKHKELRQNI